MPYHLGAPLVHGVPVPTVDMVAATLPSVSGEETHAKGADGARRAKLWLESTTRANVQWVNPDPVAVKKLTFCWADGRPFSFDLGGILLGEELQGQEFLAECKNYTTASDQGTHYVKYLAGCYRAYVTRPDRCDNFMWITWSPFCVGEWDQLTTYAKVRSSVLVHAARVLGENDLRKAEELVSDETCKEVADRLWQPFVLSEQLERFTLTRKHLGIIRQYDTEGGL